MHLEDMLALRFISMFALLFVSLAPSAFANENANPSATLSKTNIQAQEAQVNASFAASPVHVENAQKKGWDFVLAKLIDYGISPDVASRVLGDARMPSRETLIFSLDPKESKHLYRKHNTSKNRANALQFYRENESVFRKATQEYRVPSSVVLAILQIETHCGKFTGRNRILPGLARLAAANAPQNIESNIKAKRAADQSPTKAKILKRAQWLEDTFMPHVAASITVAEKLGMDPLEVKGSAAGAFGLPQFLPGNVLTYGADANLDGKVDIYHSADAIHSVAKFLHGKGWDESKKMSFADKRAVIWEYNRSAPYIDTVLAMANAFSPVTSKVPPQPIQKKLAPLAANLTSRS